MRETWRPAEAERLRKLPIDPVRSSPATLRALVEHFSGPSPSLFAVTEGGKEPHVSKDLARKVRKLTQKRKLDWILKRDEDRITQQAAGTQKRDSQEQHPQDLVRQVAKLGHNCQRT